MILFEGRYDYNIDEKNRIVIPAHFRQLLEGGTITRGYDNCLAIYPKEEWEIFSLKLTAKGSATLAARQNIRFFLGNSQKIEFDNQGRIKVPTALVNYVSITKECVLVGVINHLEIWSKDVWNKFDSAASDNLEVNTSELDAGGF